jgi:hypothetical protein
MSLFYVASSYLSLTGGGGDGGGGESSGAAPRGPVGAAPPGPVAAPLARASDASGTSGAKLLVCVHTICQG